MIATARTSSERPVRVATAGAVLSGVLAVPERAHGLVLAANGSGDPLYVAGNNQVASALREAGFATLVLDLLSGAEQAQDAESSALRFDLDFLAGRIVGAAGWAALHPALWNLPIGIFAGGTTAAAALVAASQRPDVLHAVVSRGGRPELAAASLPAVEAPTLLLVGAKDAANCATSRQVMELLPVGSQLQLIPDSCHLLDDPDALAAVARCSAGWFARYLACHEPVREHAHRLVSAQNARRVPMPAAP